MLHEGYTPPLHPSTLELSSYPASGSGEAANLTFAVTYMGGWEEDAVASWLAGGRHPHVRLDVTGSNYPDLYRVANITSNIGTAGPGVFEAYDHKTEQTVAEPGRTYTVKAQVEFLAEAFVSVHAIGLDGDVVTIDVATSATRSMSYLEYLAEGEDYLNHTLADPGPVDALEPPPGAVPLAALENRYGNSLKGMLSPVPRGASAHLFEAVMAPVFDAAGNVTTVGFGLNDTMPVHGIQVCAYDLTRHNSSDAATHTLLNTTDGGPACGYTDDGGQYSISSILGADPHDDTGADVFFVVLSRGYGGATEVVTYIYGAYYLYFDASDTANTSFDYSGGYLVRDLDIVYDGTGMDGAARIISIVSDGMGFFERHGQAPANLTVKWDHTRRAGFFPDKATDGAAYLPSAATMWLDGHASPIHDDSYDMHTILHELGHHVHAVHDPGLEYSCSPHWYHVKYDERCAWGEGWGQLVPHLVRESAVVQRGLTTWYDIEKSGIGRVGLTTPVYYSDTFEPPGRPIGDKVEGSIAAAMWDLADAAVDANRDNRTTPGGLNGTDDVAGGTATVVGVFFNGTYDTFAEFYDRWEIDMRRHSAERVAILHGMSFTIPSDTARYGFAGELDDVFKRGLAGWILQPNYVDVSADGSTVAASSSRGRGLQLINATSGEHMGLYAGRGYDYKCALEYYPSACYYNYPTHAADDLGFGEFSGMDGVAFNPDGRLVLVTDGPADRVQILRTDGRHAGQFGGEGGGSGQFRTPDGVAFLPNGTAAVADAVNRRVQMFNIMADGGGADYASQLASYAPTVGLNHTTQQLAAGPGGRLYAADYGRPYIWVHPLGADSGNITLVVDDYTRTPSGYGGFGGIAVGHDGLVYASNHLHGRVIVYNMSGLHGTAPDLLATLDGRPMDIYGVRDRTWIVVDEFGSKGPYPWQLRLPHGVAVGPPDEDGDVRVYAADHRGIKVYEKDRRRPAVEAVWSHTPDGNVTAGRTVEIAVNFSERVTVAGIPALILDTGEPNSNATYVSGSGSRTLTFNYTVAAGGAIPGYLDYLRTDSLVLPNGAVASAQAAGIADGSGNAANLTLPARGTAGSLAANAALWIDPSGATAPPLLIARGPPVMHAVEGRETRFAVNVSGASANAATVSYSLVGAPSGAAVHGNGTFSWTPSEEQNGPHAFAVNVTSQGNSSVRTFRIAVAEDNESPRIGAIADVNAAELSEIRFSVHASDADLPAQRLDYGLKGELTSRRSSPGDIPWGATILPNGTFTWTPSIYDGGKTHAFNVSVSDGHGGGDLAGTAFAAFNVTVADVPQVVAPIAVVSVYSLLGAAYEGETIHIGVEFGAPVRVAGSPELWLDVGGGRTAAAVYNGSVDNLVFFSYTVGPGHHSPDLEYAGVDALAANGAEIRAASGEDVVRLALPRPGMTGSLSETSDVVVYESQSVLSIGVIGEMHLGGAAEAARLAASDLGASLLGPLIYVTEYGGEVDALTADAALRAAHGDGAGPGIYVGPLDDEALHAAMPYANASGIVLVSTASTAPSLAVRGDLTFRLAPGDAMRDVALAGLVTDSAPASVHIVVDEDYYGPAGATVKVPPAQDLFRRGLGGAFASIVSPTPQAPTTGLSGPGGAWAGEAEALAEAVRSSGGGAPAVVFFGTGARLAEFAAHANGYVELRSARWFAAGPDYPSSNLLADPAASKFAALTNLTAVTWALPENSATGRIDAHLSPSGAAAGQGAYAAYDAVALLGGAAAAAGTTEPADVAAALPAQLSGYDGALGGIALDGAGDLIMPDGYRVWTVQDSGTGPAWEMQPELARGASVCEARLASPDLDFNVIPGRNSAPSMQAVINSGSLPLDRVEVSASPWRIDPTAGNGGAVLPASLAELGLGGPSGVYAPLGDGTVFAENVGIGANASAWLRLNLTGHAEVQGSTIAQNVTYTVSCRGTS